MTQSQSISYWLDSADRNIVVAKDNFKLKHFDWALFFWHLALEKTLKAVLAKQGNTPPPSHDLFKLATLAKLSLNSLTERRLKEITTFNIEARYDDYKRSFYKKASRQYAQKWMKTSEEIFLWLKQYI